ncbi:hypothetical protein AB0940_10570 [Streptomyces sp. NPDC006656]|uniref:hypothetical protein n=1 Tax=Streptomyces sp. NPDC006656 TaxID=3156899 RepID=UPI003455ED89
MILTEDQALPAFRAGARQAVRVPVGEESHRWTSRSSSRRVLLVVHNVTSAGRLLDVLPLFHDDSGCSLW